MATTRHAVNHEQLSVQIFTLRREQGRLGELHFQLAERPFVAGAQVAVQAQRAAGVADAGAAPAAWVVAVVERDDRIRRMRVDHPWPQIA